jgi:serine/threonine protein kinase
VKPENVLIHVDSNQKVTMKWADFGLSKTVNERGTCSISEVKGTKNWMAPELLKDDRGGEERGTIKSDIFAEGLVLGYFLAKGIHPFGSFSSSKIPLNIKKYKPVNMESKIRPIKTF